MTVAPRNPYNHQTTLPAGVKVDIDIDLSDSPNGVCLVGHNDGAAAIETITVQKAPLGDLFGTDAIASSAFSPLASGGSFLFEQDHIAYRKLRISCTSAGGTTITIQAAGA